MMTDIAINPYPLVRVQHNDNYRYQHVNGNADDSSNLLVTSDDDDSDDDNNNTSPPTQLGCTICRVRSSIAIIVLSTLLNNSISIIIISTAQRGAGLWGGTLCALSMVVLLLSVVPIWYSRYIVNSSHSPISPRSRRLWKMTLLLSIGVTAVQLIAAVVAVSRKWMPRWAGATSLLVAIISTVQLRSLIRLLHSKPWMMRMMIEHDTQSSQLNQI